MHASEREPGRREHNRPRWKMHNGRAGNSLLDRYRLPSQESADESLRRVAWWLQEGSATVYKDIRSGERMLRLDHRAKRCAPERQTADKEGMTERRKTGKPAKPETSSPLARTAYCSASSRARGFEMTDMRSACSVQVSMQGCGLALNKCRGLAVGGEDLSRVVARRLIALVADLERSLDEDQGSASRIDATRDQHGVSGRKKGGTSAHPI